jgi:diaminopimelate decarboxylase
MDELHLLENIAEQYGTPFQIYDEEGIIKNVKNLIETFKLKFPSFRQYFAVKATPNLNILKLLLDQECGLDCSSYAELIYAQKLKVRGDMIMYTSNYTEKKDLLLALELDANINLDDVSILDDLIEVNNNKAPKKICFRLNPGMGNTNSETESNILGGENSKFGISKEDIIKGYIKAKEYGTEYFGLHMMTGSCVLEYDYWNTTINVMFEVVNELYKLGIKLDYINIGGGIGINYKSNKEDDQIDINKLVDTIYNTYNENITKYNLNYKPTLYMENGRYITGKYGKLVSRCHVIKKTNNKIFYGLDASMANLMRPGMYNSYHNITIPSKQNGELINANVVGTLCENNDWFAKDRLLPVANKYDLFVIHDTGAHGHSMGFNYNSKFRCPEILYTKNKEIKLIRKGESVEDLIKLILIFP